LNNEHDFSNLEINKMIFSNLLPDDEANRWRYQLDQFVEENQQDLAALAWGLAEEWGNSQETLGIDLKPQPHFVCCPREAVEKLNRKVNKKLQEILGIIDGYQPTQEVVILGIGDGQIKLIHFQPDPPPPICFEEFGGDLDSLIQQLEQRLREL
jgi:hypothetical protein